MRQDSAIFAQHNNQDSKDLRLAIKFSLDKDGLDYHIITSHKDMDLPAGVVADGDPLSLNELQTLVLSSPAAYDYLGGSVSFCNDGSKLLMVAAAFDGGADHNIGRVKIADVGEDGKTFTINHTLLGADTTIDDHFGLTAHMAGNGIYAIVGAPREASTVSDGGALYIFKWNGSTWVEHKRLEPTGLAANNQFSWKGEISEDGMTVLATAPFTAEGGTNRGAAWIFETTDDWSTYTETKLQPSDAGDNLYFGYGGHLSANGEYAFIGAREPDDSGSLYIFERGGAWSATETQKIAAYDGGANQGFAASASGYPTFFCGTCITSSYDGVHVLVGAKLATDEQGNAFGAVYYLVKSNEGPWIFAQKITPETGHGAGYWFGYKLDITRSGHRAIIGSQGEHTASLNDVGAFYLLSLGSDGKYQTLNRVQPQSPVEWEYSGFSVAMDAAGKLIASGSTDYTDTATSQGCVRIFESSTAVAFTGLLKSVSGTSQSVNPLDAVSSIGNLSYVAVDKDKVFTNLLSTRWRNGDSLRNRKAELIVGYRGMEWDDYSVFIKQIHKKIEYYNGSYKGSCNDIQREARKTILRMKSTHLAVTLVEDIVSSDFSFLASDNSINSLAESFSEYTSYHIGHKVKFIGSDSNDGVFTIQTVSANKVTFAESITDEDVTGAVTMRHVTLEITSSINPFPNVSHGPEYQNDSPNETVGYIRVKDEVIRWNPTDGFDIVDRGVFSTKIETHQVNPSDIEDRKPEVKEFSYFEGPTILLAYRLLTGYDPGGTVRVLPDDWTLGIDPSLINADSFLNIGEDIWDTNNNDNGLVFVFHNLEDEDGKSFIEKELLLPSGCFPRVAEDGRYEIKRFLSVLEDATPVYKLDDTNILDVSALVHDYDTIRNIFEVNWNYNFITGKTTRTKRLIDYTSIAVNEVANSLKITLRGLHGSRHTEETLYKIFNFLRDRYSFHSINLTVRTKFTANAVNIGDIVHVNTKVIQDFVGGAEIDRSMEIQSKTLLTDNPSVSYRLFGSSRPAGPLVRSSGGTNIPNSWFTSKGSPLNGDVVSGSGSGPTTTGTQITVTVSGNLLTITGSGQLDGVADINSATASADNDQGWFHWNGDIIVAAGVTLTLTQNVMISYTGIFTNLGTINLVGTGLAASASGQSGQVGRTETMGGLTSRTRHPFIMRIQSDVPTTVEGVWPDGLPSDLNIRYDGTDLVGLPSSLMGCSGATGGSAFDYNGSVAGGAGGSSGGGFYLAGRGYVTSPGASVNVSGAASSVGTISGVMESQFANAGRHTDFRLIGGSGAPGHNGAWVLIVDGPNSIETNALSSFIAQMGEMPIIGARLPNALSELDEVVHSSIFHSYYEGLSDTRNRRLSFYKKVIIDSVTTPQEDRNPQIVGAPTITSLVSDETAMLLQPTGELVPRIQINWTPDTTDLYVTHFEVEYKEVSETSYTPMPVVVGRLANRTHVYPVVVGEQYIIRIRSVNRDGYTSDWVYSDIEQVSGQTSPPPDVISFLVSRQADGTRQFTWTYTVSPPADLAGFEIRYVSGGSGTWASMSVFPGAELLSPGTRVFESNQLAAGTYTFAIKAIDTSGNESTNAEYIITTLGDPRLSNAFAIVNLYLDGWTGTKTNCFVNSVTGYLEAQGQSQWADETAWSSYTQWNDNPYLSITYQHGTIDLGAVVGFTPNVVVVHNGTSITIEEQHSDDDVTYSSWAAIGPLVTARYVRIRFTVTITSGVIVVQNADIILYGDPVTETINDLNTSTLTGSYRIGTGDIRLPIQETYNVIDFVNLTLQQVSANWAIVLIDRDTSVGPRVQIRDNNGNLADAIIDAQIHGL